MSDSKAQKSMDSLKSVVDASNTLSSQLGYEPGSSICRNPRQILQFSKRMTTPDKLPGVEAKAQSLLLPCNLEKFNRNLNSISIKKNFEPSVTRLESLDLGSYLKHTRDLIICAAIEESNNATSNRFYEEFMHGMKEEWEGFKKEASGQLGQCGAGDIRRGRKTQIFDPACPTLLDFSVGHHFTVVEMMNKGGHDGMDMVLDRFKRLSVDIENHNANVHQFPPHDPLYDSWCLLDSIKDSISKDKLVERSRMHLEEQFFEKVVRTINGSLNVANRGGQLRGTADIYAYLGMLERSDPNIQGQNVHPWVEIFLHLRSGLREEAHQEARMKMNSNDNFPDSLKCWIQNMDSGFGDISNNSNNNGWQSAVYYVMGIRNIRDEAANIQVFNTIEDVVWSVLCRRDNGAAQQDLLREIKEMGVAHFGNNPVVYFSVLLLLQEYTEAVKYLYFESGSEDLAVEAVHMGVVLYRCGLLDREAEFAEILKDYIRRFSPQECDMALEYLLVLKRDKRVEALTELLLDSLQFEKLGGTLDPDCNREKGLIEHRVGEAEVSEIFEGAAKEACKRGQLASAVKFYFFAGKFDNGLEILCNLIGREVVGSGDLEKRQKLIALAYEYHAALKRGNKCDQRHVMDSLRDLLDLANFFDCARAMRYRDALHIVYNLGLLPPQSSSDQSSVEKFKTLTNDVRRNFSEVVVCSMKCLSLLSREAPHREYKQRADAIISFLDKIDYQLSYGALEEIRGLYENGVW